MAERDQGPAAFIIGFLLGATAGIAAALMTAPRSGEETVSEIRERGIQLKMRAEEFTAETRQRAVDQAHKLQESTLQHKEAAEEEAIRVVEQAQVRTQEMIDALEEAEPPEDSSPPPDPGSSAT